MLIKGRLIRRIEFAMKPETIPMTMAIRALKAAKVDFEGICAAMSPAALEIVLPETERVTVAI